MPGTNRRPRRSAAADASPSPASVSWSVSASVSRPSACACSTSAAGVSSPSEADEWQWRSLQSMQTLSSNALIVSDRSPRRSVSSGMTSSGGMLPRLTSAPNCRMNQACCAFCGASKSRRSTRQLVHDLVDQAAAHLAAAAEDAGRARLARLGDDLPGAGGELLADPADPLVRREDRLGVLGADLGEHAEVLGEQLDDLELALARHARSCRRRPRRTRSRSRSASCDSRRACRAPRRSRAACRRRPRGCRASGRASSFSRRFWVTYDVPQPSLTMST